MKKAILTFLLLHLFLGKVFPQAGTLDASFDGDGMLTTYFGGDRDGARAIAIQADGKIVVAGSSWHQMPNYSTFVMARYNPHDGSLDASFGQGGLVNVGFANWFFHATAAAIQSDGKIVLAGYYADSTGTDQQFIVARYNSNGTIDYSFGTYGWTSKNISSSIDIAYSVAVQSDGKIVVAGTSTWAFSTALVRYKTTGDIDSTFGTNGIVITPVTSASGYCGMALQSDGKIVVAGGSNNDFYFARYNTNGTLDNTFGNGGQSTIDPGTTNYDGGALAIQSDGKIVAVGVAGGNFAVARCNTNGSADNTFGTGGATVTSLGNFAGANDVALQSDGKIVVAGRKDNNGPTYDIAVLRYNTTGTIDNTFGTGGVVITDFGLADEAGSVAIQADGKIVVAGHNGYTAGSTFVVARYHGDATFGINQPEEVAVKVFPNPCNGKLYIELNDQTETQVCIYDLIGNCLLTKNCSGVTTEKIDLAYLSKGVYFVRMGSGDKQITKRIVLE